MAVHRVKKGLDLPIAGEPTQRIEDGATVGRVALLADDYVGMKPTMLVKPGDRVKLGQPLFENKKSPGTFYTAPGAGTVAAVNRGEKRALRSVVIDLSDTDRRGEASEDEVVQFENYAGKDPGALSGAEVRALLIESGLWTSFRTRPYSKVPTVDSEPDSIFITAIDTNPHAPSVEAVLEGNEAAFTVGVNCIARLNDGKVFLCKAAGSSIPDTASSAQVEEFEGVHPAGTVGLHIHTLHPVNRERTAWHVNYQDVVAIGTLFTTGKLDTSRVISLAGPAVNRPRLLRTRVGASTEELTANELNDGDNRVVSGSVLSGRTAQGVVEGFLGRYHHQVSALHEGNEREFLGWMTPGANKFSTVNTFISKFTPAKRFAFTTSTNGSERAMVPIGMYERIMPLDILPTFLLRALIVGALEDAEQLGCLELDEEDLALCTFVCPGKYDYGPYLRLALTQIEREG